MKDPSAAILVPAGVALLGVAALAVWMYSPPVVAIEMRVPGLDRPATGGAAVTARPLKATETTFQGKPADLPGMWQQFRGPALDGICHDTVPIARQWPPEGPPALWELQLGEGHAGAAVRDGCVFVMDYDREKEADALRCFSLADGAEIWRVTYPVVVKRNHGMSRTVPVVTEKYCVAIGPKCHVTCCDPATGKVFWLIDMVRQFGATVPPWYAGQCPLVDEENGWVILAPGGDDALLVALDCQSGEVVWKSPNPRGWAMTHVSVVPMEFAGRKTYVYCGKGGVAGIAADDGSYLWDTTDWKISIATVPSPVVLPEARIFCSGGYNSGAVMLQLRGSDAQITADTLFRLKPRVFGSTQQTPILYEGHLYGVREKDKQLVCLDLEGHEVWASGSQHKFGIGPYLIADGVIFVLSDSGKLTLAEATAEGYHQLAEAQVLDGHDCWGPMALVGGRLILRDLTTMVCLGVAEK